MNSATTRQSLGIIWDGADELEVDGVTVYGYWSGDKVEPPRLGLSSWPADTRARVHRLFEVDHRSWTVWLHDIRILTWPQPTQWNIAIRDVMRQQIEQGAIVAWCGVEGHFAEPPQLFKDPGMRSGVWAAMDRSGSIVDPPALDAEFTTLRDADLAALRAAL